MSNFISDREFYFCCPLGKGGGGLEEIYKEAPCRPTHEASERKEVSPTFLFTDNLFLAITPKPYEI